MGSEKLSTIYGHPCRIDRDGKGLHSKSHDMHNKGHDMQKNMTLNGGSNSPITHKQPGLVGKKEWTIKAADYITNK